MAIPNGTCGERTIHHRLADIGDFIDSPVKQYSSGCTPLGLRGGTEVDPQILVVDEILGSRYGL